MIKISRTGVEKYMECPRCFVLAYKYKVRPPSIPFTLNSAVDNLCKNEFDHYRKKQEPHPLFEKYDIDAVPFDHPEIDNWRHNFRGIRHIDNEVGYNFGGAVDDVWIKPNGELIISDVKTTSKNDFNWDEIAARPYGQGYKRQLEMYQWLFRKNGYQVANEAYLVYFNGLKNEPMFDHKLTFEDYVVRLECDDSWVEEQLLGAVKMLQSEEFPEASSTCENCNYLRSRWKVSQSVDSPKSL